MSEYLLPIAFLAAYFVVMKWVLPYFGVGT